MSVKNLVKRYALLAAMALPAIACMAEENPAPAPSVGGDLSAKLIPHGASCLAPKPEPCVIRKPVGSGYRLLTPDIGLEDAGEYWLVDFSKSKAAKNKDATSSFRVMEVNGNVHEIRVEFSEPAPAVAKPPARKPARPKAR